MMSKLSSKKFYYLLLGLLVLLLLLLISGVIGGNLLLQKQSESLTKLKVEDKAIESQQTALLQAKKDIERFDDLDKTAKSVVPQDKDQAKTIREIVMIAGQNGVPIKSFNFDASNLGVPTTAAPAAGAAGTTSAAGAPAAKAPISQLKPIEGIPGVYSMEIRVESPEGTTVNYNSFLRFLEGLEKNRRTAHVTLINMERAQDNGNNLKSFKLTLNAYVKP